MNAPLRYDLMRHFEDVLERSKAPVAPTRPKVHRVDAELVIVIGTIMLSTVMWTLMALSWLSGGKM